MTKNLHFGTVCSADKKLAKQTNKKLAKQSKDLASMQSYEQQYDKTNSSSTNLTNDKNSLGVVEDYTGWDYKKAAILYFGEDISVAERSKASILYVYIIISIDSAFVSYIAEINSWTLIIAAAVIMIVSVFA